MRPETRKLLKNGFYGQINCESRLKSPFQLYFYLRMFRSTLALAMFSFQAKPQPKPIPRKVPKVSVLPIHVEEPIGLTPQEGQEVQIRLKVRLK